MKFIEKIVGKINANIILRNVILAISAVIIFVFLVSITLKIVTRHNKSEQIPDLSGLAMDQAERVSKRANLTIEINDSLFVPNLPGGVILDQLPKRGTKVKPGRRVFVTVNSYSQKMVKIPYVTGYSLRQAKNNLEVEGLEIEELRYKSDIATNYVLEQQFNGVVVTRESQTEAEQGSGITLILGMSPGEPYALIPKLVGFPLNEAKSRIWEAGFNVGKIEFEQGITVVNRSDAKVYVQSPGQGLRAAPGTAVSIALTLEDERVAAGSAISDKEAARVIRNQDKEEQERLERERLEQEQQEANEANEAGGDEEWGDVR